MTGSVPAGERWSGSPARRVGLAGETWPALEPDEVALPTASKVRFAFGLAALTLLPLVAAVPVIVVLNVIGGFGTVHTTVRLTLICAPLVAAMFLAAYGSLVAIAVRSVSRLIRPGIYPDTGSTAWALWFNRAMATQARGVLFPLYASVYTRSWLRVLGIKVGRRTEVSTAVGLNRLVSLGDTSFLADDVVFAGIRARGGKLEITPIEVGSRTFLGNGAILRANTRLGTDSLVGVLSSPPLEPANGTSWFGLPALEFPRVVERADPSRTTAPPRRLVAARAAVEIVRILLPATISVVLGGLVFLALESIGTGVGLLRTALGTPLVPAYLRAMGAKVGKNVWFESLNITEFDVVNLGDGCAVNRGACLETHLFHDRVMRMGPAALGKGSTLGPMSAVLPDTILGDGCSVGARSVVLRGERLLPHTRWHGAPVESL